MFDVNDIRFNSILTPPVRQSGNKDVTASLKSQETEFSDVLNDAISETGSVKFSKHAMSRLESRQIELGSDDIKKLSDAVDKAGTKGVNDSLVVMNGLAFIVSVKDRTVVTAMPVSDTPVNVFTNIDGAVIA